jgi:peroxisomal 3,2-trans-enoyl-CoA isomerase
LIESISDGVPVPTEYANSAEKKLFYLTRFAPAMEMLRSIIDHKKVFVLALNGPGVGGGAAWFEGVSDIVLAAAGSYLQVPFNALGLVPENGSAISFAQSMGVHRTNDFLIFGRQLTVEELEKWGMVNRIFPKEGFMDSVIGFLEEQLRVNDGVSMMETKRLMNAPLRDARIVAVYNSMDALAERFLNDAPLKRFQEKKALLECKFSISSSVRVWLRGMVSDCVQPSPKSELPKSKGRIHDSYTKKGCLERGKLLTASIHMPAIVH